MTGDAPDLPATDPGAAPPGDADPPVHPSLVPLSFLLGRWEGAGVVGYPTIESARFGQEITFSHNGKPYLIYASRTWLLDEEGQTGRPLAMETGFWRPQPDGLLEVLLVHPSGISEIYLGEVTGTKDRDGHRRRRAHPTAKEVTAGRRLYGLVGGRPGLRLRHGRGGPAAAGARLGPAQAGRLSRDRPEGKKSPRASPYRGDRLDKAGQPGGPVSAVY